MSVEEAKVEWEEEKKVVVPCGGNECANGHRWGVTLALVKCPGCGSPVVVSLMGQCPICNEPTKITKIRMDHTIRGAGVTAQCEGVENGAEVTLVEMERTHAENTEKESGMDAVAEHTRRVGVKK